MKSRLSLKCILGLVIFVSKVTFVTAIETENKGIHEGLSSTDMRVISRSFGAAWVILDHLELDDLVKWHERGPRIKGDEFLWGCLTEFIQKLKGLQAQEVCVGRRCVSTFNPLCRQQIMQRGRLFLL